MASTNQDSPNRPNDRRHQQRRLILLLAAAFALIAWGSRTISMVEKGWYASRETLKRQQQIEAANRRIDALQREVAYARTVEGKDVEAKRRFGVGPPEEIWITVEAERAPNERPRPQSIADRVNGWLTDAGSSFLDRVRGCAAIISYSVGLSDVDGCIAVPEVEELETTEEHASDDTPGEAPADADATDGEAAGDAAQQQ